MEGWGSGWGRRLCRWSSGELGGGTEELGEVGGREGVQGGADRRNLEREKL